ncbi:MAG: hypothetical protein NCW75_06670 [Phycisphaera sp.]|nr:MAG: hypothetical protein NCW75_06670 [Phycisphaera sp.]
MSDIGQVSSGSHARDIEPRPIARPDRDPGQQPGRNAQAPRREPDRIEISPAARAGRETSEIRAELVIRVREEIVRGVYESPARIEGTVDALLSEFDPNA